MLQVNNLIPFNFDEYCKNKNITICTEDGHEVTIVSVKTDKNSNINLVCNINFGEEELPNVIYDVNGISIYKNRYNSPLCFIVSNIVFEPFDKIIVANPTGFWHCALFSNYDTRDNKNIKVIDISGKSYHYYVPFEGNEHLIGKLK